MRKVNINNVPKEVIKSLKQMTIINNGKWLPTNYSDYYPNKVTFVEDKIVRYHELENGDIVILKTYYQS